MTEHVSESISKRMTEMADEILTLRTRLAEVEAERDMWQEDARWFCRNADYWKARAVALARLAEVEAELTEEVELRNAQFQRAEGLEAKLAAVKKVLTEYGDAGDVGALAERIRAALTGDDRD